MLYSEYMEKVKDTALILDENTNKYYIRPDYRYILFKDGTTLSDVSDFPDVTNDIVHEELVLERDMRNSKNSKVPFLIDWLFDVLTTNINPSMIQEENELVQDALKYRQEKNAAKEEQNKIQDIVPGLNFTKKTP